MRSLKRLCTAFSPLWQSLRVVRAEWVVAKSDVLALLLHAHRASNVRLASFLLPISDVADPLVDPDFASTANMPATPVLQALALHLGNWKCKLRSQTVELKSRRPGHVSSVYF